jgi:signal transduction histidine kinase
MVGVTGRGSTEGRRGRPLAGQGGADATQRRFALLAEASGLLAGSLDYGTTLQQVARLAVPELADWCTVDVLDDDGRIRRVAAAHRDPAEERLLLEVARRYPMRLDEPRGAAAALRTGQAQVQAALTDRDLRTAARDARHLRLLRRLEPRSALIVPLVARGRRLGALSFTLGGLGECYGAADLAWAEDLARRAALALDNARLYGEARAAEQELRTLNAELARAVRLRDEFLAAAAHELKTPVAGLRLCAQLLLRRRTTADAVDPDRLDRALRTIDGQSHRLARLVERLLDLARIEAGGLAIKPQPVELGPLVRAVARAVQQGAPRHAIAVAAAEPVNARVDPARFAQVLADLLDNAVKFSPAGGAIDVTVGTDSAGEALVAVRDHGLGVAPEERVGLFDRFHRAHGGHLGGLGLGLHLSREIVERHGGRIAVEHPADGGTRFVVTVPSAD